MASGNFYYSLDETLKWEGGYSNHPKDPGGATMKGVTQARYDGYRKDHGLPTRSVKNIKLDELRTIYRKYYWDVCKCDDLPSGLDFAVFDFAVNSGPSRAAKYLQRILAVTDDGIIGPETLKEIAADDDTAMLVRDLCDDRLAFVQRLSTFKVFGKGWTRRIAGVRKKALAMAAHPLPQVKEEDYDRIPRRPDTPSILEMFVKWLASFFKS